MYFTANPNGEAEIIKILLKPALHIKKLEVIKDLSELAIKSRTARGNVLTKYEVKSITLKQKGHSTLGGRKARSIIAPAAPPRQILPAPTTSATSTPQSRMFFILSAMT